MTFSIKLYQINNAATSLRILAREPLQHNANFVLNVLSIKTRFGGEIVSFLESVLGVFVNVAGWEGEANRLYNKSLIKFIHTFTHSFN